MENQGLLGKVTFKMRPEWKKEPVMQILKGEDSKFKDLKWE